MKSLVKSIGALIVLASLCTTSWNTARACEACVNNTCTPGLEQGTYGCSDAHVECSLLQQITIGCAGRVCSTSGNKPCDNRRPVKPEPVEPITEKSTSQASAVSSPSQSAPSPENQQPADALTCGTALDQPSTPQQN